MNKLFAPVVRNDEAGRFLARMKPGIAHAVVTDPPAGWGFQNRDWDRDKKELEEDFQAALVAEFGLTAQQARKLRTDHIPSIWTLWFRDIAKKMLRVLVPGGWALVWTAPRMAHWTAQALELGGFEVRDSVAWIYGQGMPKNTNVSWLVDRRLGYRRKSTEQPITQEALDAAVMGTVLCPGREDWILARKPLEGDLAASWLSHRSGVLSIDDCRATDKGRWPKNTLLSPDLAEALGDKARVFYCPKVKTGSHETEAGCEHMPLVHGSALVLRKEGAEGTKNGRAGRGHVSKGARNTHPTVKPLDLARFLVRLVSQPGQVVVDPFCGSGSILVGGAVEGRRMVGCDLDPHYVETSKCRAAYWLANPPPALNLRDHSGPDPAPRIDADGGELRKVEHTDASTPRVEPTGTVAVVARLTQGMQDVLDRWKDEISPTARAALDHYFGVLRDPGGPTIPAGYLAGYEDSRPTPGASQTLRLFKDQAVFLGRSDGRAGATIREALRVWLGLPAFPPLGPADKVPLDRGAFRRDIGGGL